VALSNYVSEKLVQIFNKINTSEEHGTLTFFATG